MPSSFCQSPTGNNSDSEPEEKTVGFRLKPPTLIHGQAPRAGVPSQKPKEQQRSVLRPAVLQAPLPTKSLTQTGKYTKESLTSVFRSSETNSSATSFCSAMAVLLQLSFISMCLDKTSVEGERNLAISGISLSLLLWSS
uniref:Uncharacterized protein n=1 Tax=Hucho hucho TaxID=62062 RepID=A0A4W5PY08_9TELE